MTETRTCSSCREPVLEGQGFELEGRLLCPKCFCDRAQERRTLTKDDRNRLRRAVKEEMSGILPRQALRDLLEDGCHELIQDADSEPVLNRMVNDIERMCGLALCRELLDVIRGIRSGVEEHEEEIRKKIRKLAEI